MRKTLQQRDADEDPDESFLRRISPDTRLRVQQAHLYLHLVNRLAISTLAIRATVC